MTDRRKSDDTWRTICNVGRVWHIQQFVIILDLFRSIVLLHIVFTGYYSRIISRVPEWYYIAPTATADSDTYGKRRYYVLHSLSCYHLSAIGLLDTTLFASAFIFIATVLTGCNFYNKYYDNSLRHIIFTSAHAPHVVTQLSSARARFYFYFDYYHRPRYNFWNNYVVRAHHNISFYRRYMQLIMRL